MKHKLKSLANRPVYVAEISSMIGKNEAFEVELTPNLDKRIKDGVFKNLGEVVVEAEEEQEANEEGMDEVPAEEYSSSDEEYVDPETESTNNKKKKR